MWNAITFELSRTQIEYTRRVYSTLDFLGDIGGLFGALGPMFFLGVKLLQFKGLYMFLMSDMLLNDPKLAPQDKNGSKSPKSTLRRQEEMNISQN